ncbi:hypothetical protein BGZ60DRAFT_384105 [Tricladium varicosporioides]|nr:hypothetical protein BGZ60DRAFT_384105 [Hymenoscyphus varicosporioides]
MQFPTGINRRYAFVAGSLLLVLWLWVASDRPSSFPSNIPWATLKNPFTQTNNADVFDFPIVKSQAIKDVCARTEWNSSLIFTCDNNHGGVGHVRNSILNCVRFAMSAGASLVLPNIALREMEAHDIMEADEAEHNGKRHGPGRKGIDYMFDKEHFMASLLYSCPQMEIIPEFDQYASSRRRALLPESLVNNHPTSGLEHPEQWKEVFDAWVDEHIEKDASTTEPIVIDLEQSFLQYPTHSDGHAFAHSFGKLLKFRSDTRLLATETLHKLSQWYELELDLHAPVMNESFFGAHLRTEHEFPDDYGKKTKRHAVSAPYEHFPAQAQSYLQHASSSGFSLIYISSGNLSSVDAFVSDAKIFNIDVTHKYSLLKEEHRDHLEELTWDQRALVDFMVLEKAQEFVGVGHSAFSWNVAKKRQENVHESGAEKPVGTLAEDGTWSDKFSTLYGTRKGYVESAGCMWE